ncbi:hypothetical protein KC866_02795 [Patescibacteria group bacterium]|nr:hypothetical protein [Patescibacteria group bacterium]
MNTHIDTKKILNALYPNIFTAIGLVVGYFVSIQEYVLQCWIRLLQHHVHVLTALNIVMPALGVLTLVVLFYQFVGHHRTPRFWLIISFILGLLFAVSYFSIDIVHQFLEFSNTFMINN